MSEHEERMWRLAGAKTRCPEYYEMTPGDGGSCNKHCKAGCEGTGQVYLLGDAVREPCDSEECGSGMGETVEEASDCLVCHGLGYTPTTDGMVWVRELTPVLGAHCKQGDYITPGFFHYQRTVLSGDLPAALEAAENALIAAGRIEAVPAEERKTP